MPLISEVTTSLNDDIRNLIIKVEVKKQIDKETNRIRAAAAITLTDANEIANIKQRSPKKTAIAQDFDSPTRVAARGRAVAAVI